MKKYWKTIALYGALIFMILYQNGCCEQEKSKSQQAIHPSGYFIPPSIRKVQIDEAYCPDGYKLENFYTTNGFNDASNVGQICRTIN